MSAPTTPPAIVRMLDADTVHEVMRRFGGTFRLPSIGWYTASRLPITAVRQIAAEIRSRSDADLPDRPRLIADALEHAANTAESMPVDDWDAIVPAGEHLELVQTWAKRCEQRSWLLEGLAREMREFSDASDPYVVHARRILSGLADADLLVPGVDAALRRVLTGYAGLSADGAYTNSCPSP